MLAWTKLESSYGTTLNTNNFLFLHHDHHSLANK